MAKLTDYFDIEVSGDWSVSNGLLQASGYSFGDKLYCKLTAKVACEVSFNYIWYLTGDTADVLAGIGFNGETVLEVVQGGPSNPYSFAESLSAGDALGFNFWPGDISNYFQFQSFSIDGVVVDDYPETSGGDTGGDAESGGSKGVYIGVYGTIPTYGTAEVAVTTENIENYFTVENGSYYFAGDGNTTFTSNNGGVSSSTATTTFIAKTDMEVSFDYSYSSESGYDKFKLLVAETTVENDASGATTNKSWSGSLKEADTIYVEYSKDSSVNSNDDKCTISNIVVTTTVQTGEVTGSFARKVKKIFIGIDGIARKVKKAYIGVGGVARLCFSGGELAYYGTAESLNSVKINHSATTAGDYAIFGYGENKYIDGGVYWNIDAYNKSLTHIHKNNMSGERTRAAATSIGNYAVFGGGHNGVSPKNDVVTINGSLTTSDITVLQTARYYLAATTVGNYALFGGGETSSSISRVVDAYNASLTRTKPSNMNGGGYELAATTVGNYALFGGGCNNQYSGIPTVDVYNTSLTHSTANDFSAARHEYAATTVGNYALFGGGRRTDNSTYATVDVYNNSLTKSIASSLSVTRFSFAAATVGGYAIFAGGSNSGPCDAVDAYDGSLTKQIMTSLSKPRSRLAATTIGDYALFGGGYDSASGKDLATVDVYTVA